MALLKNNLYPRKSKPWTNLENQRFRLLFPKYSNSRLAREFGRTPPALSTMAGKLGLKKDVSKGYQLLLSDQRRWTGKETDFLLRHYKTMTVSNIAAVMERSCYSVDAKAVRLGLKKPKPWMLKKKQFRELYSNNSLNELARKFGCSIGAIRAYAKKTGLPRKVYLWSKEEIEYLTKNYHLITSDQLAKYLKHSARSIYHKAGELSLRSGRLWTEKQKQYLKRWYYKKPLKEIAKSLGRSLYAVQGYASSLGLRQRHWSRHEVDKLIRLYGKGLTKVEIASRLGRSENSVHYKLRVTGLRQKRPR